MLLAVLEARCKMPLSSHDVYLNVAGGLRILEPAADLAVAAALVSSVTDIPVPVETVIFGEVGLSGEVRAVAQQELRLKEAKKLGFSQAFIPAKPKKSKTFKTIKEIGHLQDIVDIFKS